MKKGWLGSIGAFLQLIFGIALLIGLCYFIYKLIELLLANITSSNSNIIVALIAGIITVTGYFITRYLEKRKIVEQQIREQKLPIYEEFLDFFFKMMHRNKSDKLSDQELKKFVIGFSKKGIIWLSDDTLKAYVNWRDKATTLGKEGILSKEDNIRSLLEFEKLLLAFRKDIGHKNLNLRKGDILSIFVNDLQEYIPR